MIEQAESNLAGLSALPTVSSAGARLRAAREAQGVHIAMLAVSLKVPVKKLEALEADQYALLTDMVFVRALAASVCRALKLDSASVLELLPRSELPRIKTDESGLNATFIDSSSSLKQLMVAFLRKPIVWGMAFLIAGLLLLIFWPTNALNEFFQDTKSVPTQDQMPVDSVAQLATEGAKPAADVVQLRAVDSLGVGGALTNVFSPNPSPSSSTPMSPQVAPNKPPASEGVLGLQATGASWVEVTDSEGAVLVRRILEKNESLLMSGKLPLAVVLGRADQVVVTVRGQAFDTASIAKTNVARFEVKK